MSDIDEYADVEYSRTIGRGGFGKVYLAIRKSDGKKVAVKLLDKVTKIRQAMFLSEYQLLRSLHHPNIIECFGLYENSRGFYLCMEYMDGGNLLDRIVSRTKYTEDYARNATRAILEAVAHMHDQNIIHVDLKPENCVLRDRNNDLGVVIIDFGLAIQQVGRERWRPVGTLNFNAPEMINSEPCGKEVDMWAIGVIVYCLLSGTMPFPTPDGSSQKNDQIRQRIGNILVGYPQSKWGEVSATGQEFVKGLLCHVDQRMTVHDAMNHHWV
jgi:serine/threonine protein kinase